jgi:hypothetical protein
MFILFNTDLIETLLIKVVNEYYTANQAYCQISVDNILIADIEIVDNVLTT